MKNLILLLFFISLATLNSCGKDNNSGDKAVAGVNTLSTQGYSYQFCGTIISQNFAGNIMYSATQMPIRLYPENYSQSIQNMLDSAGKGRSACVYSRSEPTYEYGFFTFYVEAVQFQ